eukprot:c48895_g1_i1 orf=65-244(+)
MFSNMLTTLKTRKSQSLKSLHAPHGLETMIMEGWICRGMNLPSQVKKRNSKYLPALCTK